MYLLRHVVLRFSYEILPSAKLVLSEMWWLIWLSDPVPPSLLGYGKILQHNTVKFSRASVLQNICERLLLDKEPNRVLSYFKNLKGTWIFQRNVHNIFQPILINNFCRAQKKTNCKARVKLLHLHLFLNNAYTLGLNVSKTLHKL